MNKCKRFVTSDRLLNQFYSVYLLAPAYTWVKGEPNEKSNEKISSGAQGWLNAVSDWKFYLSLTLLLGLGLLFTPIFPRK